MSSPQPPTPPATPAPADSPVDPAADQAAADAVDVYDKTDASHSTAPHDNPPGPANPTMPGEAAAAAAGNGGAGQPGATTPGAGDHGTPSSQVPAAPAAASGAGKSETFRANADAAVDAEIEAALSGTDVSAMMEASAEQQNVGQDRLRGTQAGVVGRVDLSKGEILVDLGGKHQAIVPARQFEPVPAEGEFVEVDIEAYDNDEGIYRAHRKGAARKIGAWEELQPGQVVEATVTGMNKGGLECRIGATAIRAFMPAGQVDTQFQKDISVFLNQKIQAKITKLDKAERNVVLSRRAVLEAEARKTRQETLKTLDEGQVLKGTIKSVKDFGAFVDLGGVDGLLHVSQLTHKRMANAADFVKEGDEVEVRVERVEKGGKGGAKIGLALSHRPPDPWEQAETKYSVGSQVTGRVTRVENFGCFVELEEGIEALLPASETSWRRVRHPSEVTNVGEQLRLMVIGLEPKARKLTLSLKQAGGDPWADAASKYPAGASVTGKVTRVQDFGAFVELEAGVDGLIHISEMSENRVRRVEDVVRLGQDVEARVLEVDPEKRRLRLSLKKHDPQAEAKLVADAEKRVQEKKQRQKRLQKQPLKGGLDF